MLKLLSCNCSEKWGDWSPLILRLATGIVFAAHGYQKWQGGVEGVSAFFGNVGIPMALAAAYLITYLELLGGILLILGLFTHILGKLFAIEMLVAFFFVHMGNGIFVQNGGYELALILFAASVSLMITGGGRWALEKIWHKEM